MVYRHLCGGLFCALVDTLEPIEETATTMEAVLNFKEITMEKNPGKILQQHGIEIALDDPRTTAQVLADMIARNVIQLESDEV